MIALPVPSAGPDVTWIIMGFLLGFLGIFLLLAAWWTETSRNDRTDAQIAALWKAIPERVMAPADADTDEIPVIERPQPLPGPATVPIEEALTPEAVAGADEWAARWDAEIAEMRAKWDSEDAA